MLVLNGLILATQLYNVGAINWATNSNIWKNSLLDLSLVFCVRNYWNNKVLSEWLVHKASALLGGIFVVLAQIPQTLSISSVHFPGRWFSL